MIASVTFRLRPGASWLAALAAAGLLGGGAWAQTPAAAGPAAAASAPAQQSADYIVAVVNSEPITNSEVRARRARVLQQLAQQRRPAPPMAELNRQVLERMIIERAQLQVARDYGIKIDDNALDQAERNVARQNSIDLPELRRRLSADGITYTSFREDLRNQLVLARLRDREVESRVRVTDVEVEQFLREQRETAAAAPAELNIAQILVAVPETATPEQQAALRQRAERLLARARAGEDFARLAAQASDAMGASANGGALGLRTADRYPDLFVQAVARLPVGGISELVQSGAGFHVLKLLERKESGGMTVVQSRSRHILLRPGPRLDEAAARERLADFKRRIESRQADFATLAREHSQDGSAANGGDLGWASPGMFVPEFEEVLDALAPGQIAPPFVSRFGVHLVQLLERREARLSPREEREVARNELRQKKLDEAFAQWAEDIRSRAFVDLREPPQ